MKLHFACLFGLSYDRDLLGHFLAHYKDIPFESSMLFFHGDYDKDVFEQTRDAGFNATFVNGEFRDGTLRSMVLRPFCTSLPKGDKVMIVDSDEFVSIQSDFMDAVADNDVVTGTLWDRYSDRLHPADPDIPLSLQYCYTGDFYKVIAKCEGNVAGVRRKVITCNTELEINLIGSHYLMCEIRDKFRNPDSHIARIHKPMDNHPDLKYHTRRIPIMHYSFRDSIIERMGGKSYFTMSQICNVARYYGVPLEDIRVQQVKEKFDAIQQSMGWVPA